MSVVDEDRRLMRAWLASGNLDDKRAWLDLRCNGYHYDTPSGTLEVAVRTLETHTTWRHWLDVRENDRWVANINQMSIPRCMLVLDLDPQSDELPDAFAQRIERTKQEVVADGGHLMSDCTTGSRGHHLEFFIVEWATLAREKVREYKLLLLEHYGADLAKAAPRVMLHIAGMPNPKTGLRKKEVRV